MTRASLPTNMNKRSGRKTVATTRLPGVPWILSLLLCSPTVLQANESRDGFWKRGAREALTEGEATGKWVLVYFPDPGKEDPPQVRSFSLSKKMSTRVTAGRVRAREVENLVQRFLLGEASYPALVLVNPYGETVCKWQESWRSTEVVGRYQAARRKLKRLFNDIETRLDRAERALELARSTDATRYLEEARQLIRAGFPHETRVANLLETLLKAADHALIEVLALDGLVSDTRLLDMLARVEKDFPLKEVAERLAREKKRVRERKIGGGSLPVRSRKPD